MLIKLDSDFFCSYIDFLNIPDIKEKSFSEAFELINNVANTAVERLSFALREYNKGMSIYLDDRKKNLVTSISNVELNDGFICIKGGYIGSDSYNRCLYIRFQVLPSLREDIITDNSLYINDNNLEVFLGLLYKNTEYKYLIPTMFTLLTLKEE